MTELTYELSFVGGASDTLAHAFEGYSLAQHGGITVLRSSFPDQAALHGVINLIQELGLELFEIHRLDPAAGRI